MMRHDDVHLVELLAPGRHCHPRTGGCLLELVSTVPGGVWTDSPPGLDPTLGSLARAVNDATSDGARPALAPLIPWLAELTAVPPLDRTATAAAVAAAVAAAATPLADDRTARKLTAAATAASLDGGAGRPQRIARRRAALRAVRLAVHTLARSGAVDSDAALRAVLAEAVDLVRLRHGLPPVPTPARSAAACRLRVPVRTRLLARDGAESLFHHCTAVLDLWPSWLVPPQPSAAQVPRAAGVAVRT
jgi:hypothetical protein